MCPVSTSPRFNTAARGLFSAVSTRRSSLFQRGMATPVSAQGPYQNAPSLLTRPPLLARPPFASAPPYQNAAPCQNAPWNVPTSRRERRGSCVSSTALCSEPPFKNEGVRANTHPMCQQGGMWCSGYGVVCQQGCWRLDVRESERRESRHYYNAS